ncbi:hypothetical protein [Pseudomonas sp. URMO17WK12:I11]|uniref:hypothetical protein n=1 Tax=Pseudomonas sp. URMO17WK12:I11 TaxID=1283291 RepID=UPI0011A05E25|nr:hypothetical protein [Pseudomonas sp. URMO17WK12:I11]
MSFTLDRALAAEPKILPNGMKSFDHFRKLAGNPKLDEFFVDAVELEMLLPGLPLAGDSALDKLTMLADNSYRTYAVSLTKWNTSGGLERKGEVSIPPRLKRGDHKGMALIEIWVEEPPTVLDMYGSSVVEPLHLALTYTDEKLEFDERVSSELGQLLEGLGYEFENRWS